MTSHTAPETAGAVSQADDSDQWLRDQLAAWPQRIDPERTTNIEFLMKSAAALIDRLASEQIEAIADQSRIIADTASGGDVELIGHSVELAKAAMRRSGYPIWPANAEQIIAHAIREAVADTEARVVAWLTEKEGAWRFLTRSHPEIGAPHVPRVLADAIARREHTTGETA